METLIIVGIPILVIAIVFLVSYLMRKFNVSKSELTEGIDVTMTTFRLIRAIADDANLGDKETIDKISKIVIDGLEYVKVIPEAKENKKLLIEAATGYSIDIALAEGIEIDENRKYIIEDLVTIGVNLYFVIDENQ